MGILLEDTKVKSNILADVSVDLFLNSVNASFLTGKAIEHLVEKGCHPQLKEHESILNAIYYLIVELEENHGHELDEWRDSPIFQYISKMSKNSHLE